MGPSTGHKSETSELIYSLSTFQDGRLTSSEKMLKQNDFLCKLDLKDAYFCIPLGEKSKSNSGFFGKETCTNLCACVLG